MANARRWVAFLRAVNVGKRRTPMEKLRSEIADLDFGGVHLVDVSTYLNSGNVIFTAAGVRLGSRHKLETAIEERLEETFGFEVTTFVRTDEEVAEILARAPFRTETGETPHCHTHMVMLLKDQPPREVCDAIEELSGKRDRLEVHGSEVHWLIEGKSLDTALERRDWKVLGDRPNTTRNLTMLTKLQQRLPLLPD